MFKNDERYWDINVLNKWFAISSIIFLAATVWTFIDDNDDEFKEYQREFRKMQVEIEKKKGCYFSRMTGSGSVCYGVFKSEKTAKAALNRIKLKYPRYWLSVAKTI